VGEADHAANAHFDAAFYDRQHDHSTDAELAHIIQMKRRHVKMCRIRREAGQMSQFEIIKKKQRSLREGFPEALALRVHRSISWLGRAEQERDDIDVQFILYWIGFNAAYAADLREEFGNERDTFRTFFSALVDLDTSKRIYNAVWDRFSQEIRVFLDNQYVFAPFWAHQNGFPGNADWEARLIAAKKRANEAVVQRDTVKVLTILFDRLYVLRNQLLHGGATWNSQVNRNQVRDGASLLATLLPVFIDLMLDAPQRDWGQPFYPVVR